MKQKRILAFLLALVMLFALAACGGIGSSFSESTSSIQKASNSVVMLYCYDKNGELSSTGSAFAVFEKGVFVTNFHVIEANTYRIQVQLESGLEFPIASVIAYDSKRDLAILSTDVESDVIILPYSTAPLVKGEKVVAIGSPLGLINSVSTGVYSGAYQEDGLDYLQFTAPISPGSSGGALFNDLGEVIGITSSFFVNAQNINLAIPIECAKDLYSNSLDDNKLSVIEFYNAVEKNASVVGLWEAEVDMRDQMVEQMDASVGGSKSFGEYLDSFVWVLTLELRQDGTYTLSYDIGKEMGAFKSAVVDYMRDMINEQVGMEVSDDLIAQALGMSLDEYAQSVIDAMTEAAETESATYRDEKGTLIWEDGAKSPYELTEDSLSFSVESLGKLDFKRIG